MRTLIIAVSIAAAMIASGCATAPLTAQESAVRILRKSDPPASCREIGRVSSSPFAALTQDTAEADLRREVAKVGGDTVTLDAQDDQYSLTGVAYGCGTRR